MFITKLAVFLHTWYTIQRLYTITEYDLLEECRLRWQKIGVRDVNNYSPEIYFKIEHAHQDWR